MRRALDPATGEPVADAAWLSREQLLQALAGARRAADEGPWRAISLRERKEFLLRISRGILERAGELAMLETLNTGKPLKESTFMDIPSAAKTFEHFALHLEEYLQEESLRPVAHAQGTLIRQPRGVALLIVPWNYPLIIASWKMASALAAGNTVILKPSSLTPLTALALAEIVHSCGLPPGVVQVVNASGEDVQECLCADARVDMISFTGGNEVGRKIIASSAPQVKKLVMELGGKSASLVLADADLELAVNGSLCSIFLNQGQMCTAMSRIFVQEKVYEPFLKDFAAKASRIVLGKGIDAQTQMGPLISREQRERVQAFVAQAQKEGAKVVCGGCVPRSPELAKGFFFEPTVLSGVTSQMQAFREEVFGPVVCVGKFSTIEEGIALANASEFGLASCVWSANTHAAEEIGRRIDAGLTWINTYGMFYDALSYGGFKQSGFGYELGRAGFLEYTRLKTIVTDRTEGAKPLVNYWYGF